MENENKEFQNSAEESELQEKVNQDVSEKIAEAAAELQDEIDLAEEAAATEGQDAFADVEDSENEENAEDLYDAGFAMAEEEVPVKEPKKVTMTLSSLVCSLIGTAVIGALILLLGLQIPKWVEAKPEGKTVATVDGTAITDVDMRYYIYYEAMQYFQENAEDVSASPADYDWAQTNDEGKTIEEAVKEKALDAAIQEVLLMNAGDKNGVEFDAANARQTAESQNQQMISTYGEELVLLNAQRQGLPSLKQYARKIEQAMHLQAVEADMQENRDKYYPQDNAALNDYRKDDAASFMQILIQKETAENEEGQPALDEEKKAKAEETLARIQSGEDFDTVMEEVNEDPSQTADGYTFTKGLGGVESAVEDAVLALKLDEVGSAVVETSQGWHIIKRIAGSNELEGYLRAQAKVSVKNGKMAKLSLKQILQDIDDAGEKFDTLYAEQQNKK